MTPTVRRGGLRAMPARSATVSGYDMNSNRRFEKQVEIKATDSAAQRATGVVLTPWAVDTQRDFLRPEGIRNLYSETPDNGVMHAAFPDDAATLERNDVLEEPSTIDGVEFDAGEWVITREYGDDELWSLVDDGVLNGFSIGGRITQEATYGADELPGKVRFPDGVEPGEATEIRDGEVDEISDVDIPAVPDAEYATVKAVGKSAYDAASGREEFVSMMTDRGHQDGDARRLYDYIDRHADANRAASRAAIDDSIMTQDSDDQPDDATKWRRFKAWLAGDIEGAGGDPDDGTGDSDGDAAKAVHVPEVSVGGALGEALSKARDATKQGRSLNAENRQSLMAAHDAIEVALSSDLDFEQNRFTDDPFTDFDVADYAKSADIDTTDMSDNDDDSTLSEKDVDRLEELITEKVDEAFAEKSGDDTGDDPDEGAEKAGDERPEWADEFAKQIDELEERVDAVAKSTAGSGQIDQPVGDDEVASEKRAAIEKEKEVFTR